MKIGLLCLGAIAATSLLFAPAQQTPKPMAACYGSLADAILSLKQTEATYGRSLLDGHYHAAKAYMGRGDAASAAAEMALFANEGDNTIGGIRKRLLEGGHHHNAAGEAKGIFEPGFVIVTREAKRSGLAAASALRQAKTEGERAQAWEEFDALATELLGM